MVESKQERSFVMEPFVSNPLQLFFPPQHYYIGKFPGSRAGSKY